jgi:hypothetical protein
MRIAFVALALVAAACGQSQLTAHHEWTCAAYCMAKWHCVDNGDSTWSSDLITSKGDTAADAFSSLAKQCKDFDSDLVTHFQCESGVAKGVGATIESSCAAD